MADWYLKNRKLENEGSEDHNDGDVPSEVHREVVVVWNSKNRKLEDEASKNINDGSRDLKQAGEDRNDTTRKFCGECQKQFGNWGGFKNNNGGVQLCLKQL